jgi:serine/threonine protein kinase
MDTLTFERPPYPLGVNLLDGTYRLLRLIGKGGMGEVYEASHARLPGRFAVKILLPELASNREAFARFCREAEIMSELRHPNIVQVFDFNAAPDGRPYFVMEYLQGRDLEARLDESPPLQLPAVVRIVNAVASGLAAAHAHGVVHRDLKPSNIFLATVNGQTDELVKVLDFGISKVRAGATRISRKTDVLGTPPYMAPEQALGRLESVDGRTDQFALGAIAYLMLTGYEAFRGEDTAALLYQVVHEEPPPLARFLPPNWDTHALQTVIDRALNKDPNARWSGMMEMARAFEDAAERTIPTSTPAHAGAVGASTGGDVVDLDEPPPVRNPPMLRLVTPHPAAAKVVRPLSQRRVEPLQSAIEFPDDSGSVPKRRSSVDWELPSSIDRIPVSRTRAAVLGVIVLALVGLIIAKGWHREAPAAFSFVRQSVSDWIQRPAPVPQPEAAPADL